MPGTLYAMPPATVTAAGGDTVSYAGNGRGFTIKLHTKGAATGAKLYAIRSLQLACSVMSGDLAMGRAPQEGITWHIFRTRAGDFLDVRKAVLGIADGEPALAAAYCDNVDGRIAEALQELDAA